MAGLTTGAVVCPLQFIIIVVVRISNIALKLILRFNLCRKDTKSRAQNKESVSFFAETEYLRDFYRKDTNYFRIISIFAAKIF